MPKRSPDLYPLWRRIGVNFTGESATTPVDIERLIFDTAMVASTDERLMVLAASWLAQYHDVVDGRRLSELARLTDSGTRAYLGALLTLARDAPDGAKLAPQFEAALSQCQPMRPARAFYDVARKWPNLGESVEGRALPLFRKWGLWHDDAQLQRRSLFAREHVLRVPEMKSRAGVNPVV